MPDSQLIARLHLLKTGCKYKKKGVCVMFVAFAKGCNHFKANRRYKWNQETLKWEYVE